MIALYVLLGLLLVVSWTDISKHEIPNWATYPGMVIGLLLNIAGLGKLGSGLEGGLASLGGFLLCGFIILFAFILFPMGGGDVKIIAMIGAFLGVEHGLMALLWTFSVGFVIGAGIVIWQNGFLQIVRGVASHALLVLKARRWISPSTEQREPLKQWLFLAPAALVGTILTGFPQLSVYLPGL